MLKRIVLAIAASAVFVPVAFAQLSTTADWATNAQYE
jgi:hypothetical protein